MNLKLYLTVLLALIVRPTSAQYQAELDTTCSQGVATIRGTWIGDARDKGTFSLLAYVGPSGLPFGDPRPNPIDWREGPFDPSLIINLDTATFELRIEPDTWWTVPTCYLLNTPAVQTDPPGGLPPGGMHPMRIENNFCPMSPLNAQAESGVVELKNRFEGHGPFFHFSLNKFSRYENYESLPVGIFIHNGRKYFKTE